MTSLPVPVYCNYTFFLSVYMFCRTFHGSEYLLSLKMMPTKLANSTIVYSLKENFNFIEITNIRPNVISLLFLI